MLFRSCIFFLYFLKIFCTSVVAQNVTLQENQATPENSKTPILELYYCDPDGNGQIELDIEQISQQGLNYYGLDPDDPEAIYISTSIGAYLKVSNPSDNPTVDMVCNIDMMLTDIAVDEVGSVYVNTYSEIYKFEPNSCDYNILFSNIFDGEINSLSFDTGGNMYFGFGNQSMVYRYDADGLTDPYVWHDFLEGRAGGDFVMVDDKLYISWYDEQLNILYEVTVDESYNYVSHIDRLELPNDTFGLASEFGSLYGVTPEWLYKINLDTNTFESVLDNNDDFGEWYGAAGLHEGMILESTAFLTLADANSNSNPLPETYTIVGIGQQTIYIRIENLITGEYIVYSVIIHVDNVPQITQPDSWTVCNDEDFYVVDLTIVEDQLLQNVSGSVIVSYHISPTDAEENLNPLPTIFESNARQETIYLRVTSTNSDCYATTSFSISIYPTPEVAPLVNNISERSLSNCYIDKNGNGYFKLEEIYEQLILDGDLSYDISFYLSYEDALNGRHRIQNIFYSQLRTISEIFVEVINREGCSVISNFFVDGECVKYTLDLESVYFPQYFTPNNDGYNDFWNVKGISKKLGKESTVIIFDRFGKNLYIFKPSSGPGWDGTVNGKPMPSSDYSFVLTTPWGKRLSGHFTLKR